MSLIVSQTTAQVEQTAPLSGMVAITHEKEKNIVKFVKAKVDAYAYGALGEFPLPLSAGMEDNIRVMQGLKSAVVAKWFDPLTNDASANAPRYGANNDYIAYFGDGWNKDWKGEVVDSAPQWNGSSEAGWIWTNHEYISNDLPSTTTAPTGQHLTLARFLRNVGVLDNNVEDDAGWTQGDIDTHIKNFKKQLGGSWFRAVRDSSGQWTLDPTAPNLRYDSTSNTLTRITGQALLSGLDHDDQGHPLPENVVAGIAGDCSGGQTPWGTIISAEENVQDYYGDLETAWDGNQKFVAGQGFDPGANISPTFAASESGEFGRISDLNERHARDTLGYLVEIDPGEAPNKYYTSVNAGGDGKGHRKLGAMGRARWENAAFAVDDDWELENGQPIVLYAANDRRGGRLYKWVSKGVYTRGMTKAQVRALLDEGTLYVAHFAGLDNKTGNTLLATGKAPTEAAPGTGNWIYLSVYSTDLAPNGGTLGDAKKTVGAALQDVNWNGIGGFPTDDYVRLALFTAEAKIGVMELNRPEDLEWNPRDSSGRPRLYIAFTNHTGGTQLDQNSKLLANTVTDKRGDGNGEIFALEEATPFNPAASKTFKYFQVWKGANAGTTPNFEAAAPDNIMIDPNGGVWFGTDGNFGRTSGKAADCVYYLDTDRSHIEGPMLRRATFGSAFRIACVASDAEATGPAFSPDMTTLFVNVQHPGEGIPTTVSTWPQDR
jgi:secreted PhoX family phosphatase